jgi:cytochrome P450
MVARVALASYAMMLTTMVGGKYDHRRTLAQRLTAASQVMDIMPNPVAALNNVPYGLRNLFFLAEFLFPATRAGGQAFYTIIAQSHDAVRQRISDIASHKPYNKNDMLSKLLDVANDPKNDFSVLDATTEVWAVIWAGSDTTYIALTAIFYFLHKYPDKLARLRNEIDNAFATGALTSPIRYTDAIKLPYLHAVVRESMRMHPSLGTGLPRIVPAPGVTISGRFFPAGTTVIMNQCAVHFDAAIFGEDCEQF